MFGSPNSRPNSTSVSALSPGGAWINKTLCFWNTARSSEAAAADTLLGSTPATRAPSPNGVSCSTDSVDQGPESLLVLPLLLLLLLLLLLGKVPG
eukprot:COSAG06_NODE_3815_length_4878_cov_7.893933_4_plen_95_part_00